MNTDDGEKRETKFKYLYHVADAKFIAFGVTLEEAFENAALAMFNVMIDTSNIVASEEKRIELSSSDIKLLLVDWLSELLFLFEVDEIIFCAFRIETIKKTAEGFSLKGIASGVPVDPLCHRFDTQVKAVTLHELEVIKNEKGEFCVQVVVDT